MDQIDIRLTTLNSAQGKTGALQNRFLKAPGTLVVSIENLTAADSAIRNADIAEEIAQLARNQIIAQASISLVGTTNLAGQDLLNIPG